MEKSGLDAHREPVTVGQSGPSASMKDPGFMGGTHGMQSNDRSDSAPTSARDDSPTSEDALRRYLIEQIARRSRVPAAEVDPGRPLDEFGLASRDAVAIAGELEQMLGRTLPATL